MRLPAFSLFGFLNRRYLAVLLFPPGIAYGLSDKAFAVTLAMDSASDVAYAAENGGAWKGVDPTADENPPGMDNGGIGFQPWDFSGGYHQPQYSPYGRLNHFIDGVDFAASSFNNLSSPAFGLTNANQAFGGHTARATRIFNVPITTGNTLTVDFDSPASLNPSPTAGFLIRLNAGGGPVITGDPTVRERFGVFVASGFNSDNWTISDSAGLVDSGVDAGDTITGGQFKFTLTSADTYSFELVRLTDRHTFVSHSGTLVAPAAGPIDSLEIAMFGNGSGNGLNGPLAQPTGEREFFFNNLRIESDAMALLGDYNGNGVVDAADYVVWRRTFGQSVVVPGSGADGDKSGDIGPADYDIWRTHFGTAAPAMSGSISAVPEPYAASLAIVGLGIVLTRFRSRRGVEFLTRHPMETPATRPCQIPAWFASRFWCKSPLPLSIRTANFFTHLDNQRPNKRQTPASLHSQL
jgi:hypothetical protein